MITLDRTQPLHEQLVAQLRYLIARGHFRPGTPLPSTRALARQLGISFHTVRKAYQQLEAEGLLHSQSGRRYLVRPEATPSRETRLERGAALMQKTLHQLIGLGLEPEDIEYLFQEQLALLEDQAPTPKVLCLAPTQELAECLIVGVGAPWSALIEPVIPEALAHHEDADLIVARHADLHRFRHHLPQVQWLGLMAYPDPSVLERIATLLPRETLGLITLQPATIPHLLTELRVATGFGGQVLAVAIEESRHHLRPLLEQADLLICTPQSRQRVSTSNHSITVLSFRIGAESLEMLQRYLQSM
ncbi:MAG: GntR family transcriptional regulator [Rhodothermus sp.]|nr:GntR family transcriptional regulator [Rhodothermus sp.]